MHKRLYLEIQEKLRELTKIQKWLGQNYNTIKLLKEIKNHDKLNIYYIKNHYHNRYIRNYFTNSKIN